MVNISDLKSQILFHSLTDNELEVIAERIREESVPQGKTIFKEGDPTVGIYLIKSGKVEITKVTPDGWKQTLAVLTDGRFFGELSVVEDKKFHGANATAIENTELYLIKTEDFKFLEDNHPGTMYKIMKTIARVASKNVHEMNDKLVKVLISY